MSWHLLMSSVAIIPGEGVVVPPDPGDGPTLPPGVPDPVLWFSPRDVELDGAGGVTKFLNVGTLGDTYDATPRTANLAIIDSNRFWGARDFIVLPSAGTGGYRFDSVGTLGDPIETVVGIATYQDGAVKKFNNYDGLWSGPVGAEGNEIQMVGTNNQAYLQGNYLEWFHDGVPVGNSSPPVLPMLKKGIATTSNGTRYQVGTLFCDNFVTSRNWEGSSGDLLFFDVVLSDAQVLEVHNMLDAWYNPEVVYVEDNRANIVMGRHAESVNVGVSKINVVVGRAGHGPSVRDSAVYVVLEP